MAKPTLEAAGDRYRIRNGIQAVREEEVNAALFARALLDANNNPVIDARDLVGTYRRMAAAAGAVATGVFISNVDGQTSFSTLQEAVAAAVSGDQLYLPPATMALGNDQIVIPAGVSVIGAGANVTSITGTLNNGAVGVSKAMIIPGSNTLFRNLTISAIATAFDDTGVYQTPFGNTIDQAGSSSAGATGVVLDHVVINGDSDGIYFTTPSSGTTDITLINCKINTKWDAIIVNPSVTLTAYDTESTVAGPTLITGKSGQSGKACDNEGGTVYWHGGALTAAGQGGGNYAFSCNQNSGGANSYIGGFAILNGATADLRSLAGNVLRFANVIRKDGTAVLISGNSTTLVDLGFGAAFGGSTTISTGVGSVRMTSANAATNVVWIPVRYAGTTYFIPGWTTNSP